MQIGISIPYGAIKSYFDKSDLNAVLEISIPYGAIKRYIALLCEYDEFVFQFLMVRLKVYYFMYSTKWQCISIPYGAIKRFFNKLQKRCRDIISIPYGAIKSMIRVNIYGTGSEFQFLMVRLKVKCPCIPLIVPPNFNSLWCD